MEDLVVTVSDIKIHNIGMLTLDPARKESTIEQALQGLRSEMLDFLA
jgi:hypothetical protein